MCVKVINFVLIVQGTAYIIIEKEDVIIQTDFIFKVHSFLLKKEEILGTINIDAIGKPVDGAFCISPIFFMEIEARGCFKGL